MYRAEIKEKIQNSPNDTTSQAIKNDEITAQKNTNPSVKS